MRVELRTDFAAGGPSAVAEVWVGSDLVEVVPEVSGFEMDDDGLGFEEAARIAVTRLRRGLAYLGVLGEMVFDLGWLEGEEFEQASVVVDGLTERELIITPEDFIHAREESRREHERTAEGFSALTRLMKVEGLKRGLTKEEREKMTLGEAFGLDNER